MNGQHDPDDGDIRDVPRPPLKIKFLTLDEVLDRPSSPWAIEKVARRGEQIGIYADPSAGKTLAALSMALSFATETDWFGYRVQGGPVLYLAGEGTVGIPNRLRAAFIGLAGGRDAIQHPVHFRLAAIDLLSDAEFDDLLLAIDALTPAPVLIIIDPLARFMGSGDENLACDMGTLVERGALLGRRFDASVVILHHTGRDGSHERGSTAWRAAMDVVLRIDRNDRVITIRGDKAKDAEELPPTCATITPEFLGFDEFDDPIHSVRLVPVESSETPRERNADEDPCKRIREALAFYGEPTSAQPVYSAAQVSRTRFYVHARAEEEAGRIRSFKEGQATLYELTETAPEHRTRKERPASRPTSSRGTESGTNPDSPSADSSRPVPPPIGADERDGSGGSAAGQRDGHEGDKQKPKLRNKKRASGPASDKGAT